MPILDVLIVGAGPSGLAAAIACERRGLEYEVVERGVVVDSIYRFPTQMVFFTTPELLEIGGLPFVSPFDKPTRLEALRYYRRVADTFRLQVSLGEDVQAVCRRDEPDQAVFDVRSRLAGTERTRQSRAVVLATGYYDQPNRLDVPGEDLPHVRHFYTEAHPYFRRRVVVVGGANSAAEAALELHRAGAKVTLVHRQEALSPSIKYWVRPDIENRIKEGAITARFRARVLAITPDAVSVERDGAREEIAADAVLLLTGYHTDRAFLRRCGVSFDEASGAPRYDPETMETDVPALFLAGGVVVGRDTAPIFIENGRLHGDKVVALIAGRLGR
jgi:bacillithiol disulfide reductase